jgi:hypothetical protein
MIHHDYKHRANLPFYRSERWVNAVTIILAVVVIVPYALAKVG